MKCLYTVPMSAALVAWSTVAAGQIIYVDHSATGLNDGTSWTNAYTDLQTALAGPPSEVWVAQGVYHPAPPDGDRELSFVIADGFAVYGGFVGGETNRDDRDPDLNPTILSGDLNDDDGDPINGPWADMGDNSYHVVSMFNAGPATLLDSLTVTRGWSWVSSGMHASGAGIYLQDSDPVMEHCTVEGNLAHLGAGMLNVYGNPTLRYCTFDTNWAIDGRGGAIYTYGDAAQPENPAVLTLYRCRFTENVATPGGGPGDAGAIWSDFYSPIDVFGCLFERNEARWRFTYGSFAANGGAILIFGDGSRIVNTVFRSNRAHIGGALWIAADVGMVNCLFSDNEAFRQSSGGYDYGGYAGALYATAGIVSVTNSAFHANHARTTGGVFIGANCDATIANSILWGNVATEVDQKPLDPQLMGSPALRYSCVQDLLTPIPGEDPPNPADFPGCIVDDPLWVDPVGVDGLPGTPDDDLQLDAASPCIDAGDNAEVLPGTSSDLNDGPRFFDAPATVDTGAGTPPIVDMGPFEFGVCRDGDVDGNCAVTPGDALLAFEAFLQLTDLSLESKYHGDVYDAAELPQLTPGDALCIFLKFLQEPSCLDAPWRTCGCTD